MLDVIIASSAGCGRLLLSDLFSRDVWQQAVYTNRSFNTLRPGQNGHYFADNISKSILLNGHCYILIQISLKFVPKGSIDNKPTLVKIMAWRRSGDKLLSKPMMI